MIEFLRENQAVITLVFAFAVTVSTIVYAILTWRLVSETRRMRKAQTDPEISVSLIQNENSINFIDLVTENIGLGSAYNIKFDILKDFKLSKRMLSEVGFIKNGITYLSPRQSMKSWIASFLHDKELVNKSIELKVTYNNSLSEQYTKQFILNFSQFAFIKQLGTPPLIKIGEHLESIEKNINDITSGLKKLKIEIYDTKDRNEEEQQRLKDFDEFNKSDEE
jgi:hypothetical protein